LLQDYHSPAEESLAAMTKKLEEWAQGDIYQASCNKLNELLEHDLRTKRQQWVLVADDDRVTRKLVSRRIQQADANVIVVNAHDGADALERLKIGRIDFGGNPAVIVLDLNMPQLDGWQVIEKLRKDYVAKNQAQGIPIIALSSTTGEKGTIFRKSVHGCKAGYDPLISIAKEDCLTPQKYDVGAEKGLIDWVKHFLKQQS